jgi:hypothetical protein
MQDWPEDDVLTASCTNSATSITVASDATLRYGAGWLLEIDSEVMRIASVASSTSLTVQRGKRASTAASHASASTILVRPDFTQLQIIDALNAGLEAAFPLVYRKVVDETLSGSASVYEYEIPDMPGHTGYVIPYISEIQLKDSSEDAFRTTRAWELVRGDTPKIKFRRSLDGGETVRLIGYGPLPRLTALGDTLHDQFPPHAEGALVEYAGAYLLGSGEAGRVRLDTGAVDNREQANAVGSSLRASDALMRRFYNRLSQASMPPPGKHVKVHI